MHHAVVALIEAADFPVQDQHAGWIVDDAHQLFPEALQSALLHRLESVQEIPFRAERLLHDAGMVIDEGPLAELVVHPQSPKKITGAAVSIVGPNTIAQLIDQLLTIDRQIGASAGQADRALHDERYRLLNWIASTRLGSFAEAILTRSDTREPRDIALLAEMLARHGEVDNRGPLPLHGPLYTRIVDTVERWMEILLASTVATRQQYAEVAQAIERLPAPQLVPGLQRLLAADLVQWLRARDEATIARAQSRPPHPDAYL